MHVAVRGRNDVWQEGERAALDAYRRRGFRLVAKNWRSALGELDLILEKRGLIVFCEVKARTGARLGGGYEAVTHAKRRKVSALAEAFLAGRRVADDVSVRFDVASVHVGPWGSDVHIFADAF